MPALRTEITEIVTGLGALGDDDLGAVMAGPPPPELRNVGASAWSRLVEAHAEGTHRAEMIAAWNNGRSLLRASDGLRGRRPVLVEWKGAHRDPGDESVPADLRIDHVYLVSCKYLSKVLHNAAPVVVFDRLLAGGSSRRSEDNWFDSVAAAEHQRLYQLVRRNHAHGLELPEQVRALSGAPRAAFRGAIPRDWAPECAAAYQDLVDVTARRSADRWRVALAGPGAPTRSVVAGRERSLLWRILRLASAPYFVLGTGPDASLRLRVATPWDWNQRYELLRLEIESEPGGQARVGWRADVRDRDGGEEMAVVGHVEVRWSHGRFGGHPEAKVYLDTPHARVPGYFPLV